MATFDSETASTTGKVAGPFNPNLPEVGEPNFLNLSRGIGPVESNKAFGRALAGIGDTLEVGAKGLDFAVKTGAADQIHAAVDAEQERRKKELESRLGDMLAGGVPVTRTAAHPYDRGGPLDILPSQKQIPGDLEDLPRLVGNIAASKEKGLPRTYYEARLDALASDFRARYPGYRDFIDETFARATSARTTANQYINALTSTIDSISASRNAEQNKAFGIIEKYMGAPDEPGRPGAATAAGLVRAGVWGVAEAIQWAKPYARADFDRDQWVASHTVDQGMALQNFQSWGGNLVNGTINNVLPSIGMSPAQITQMIATGKDIPEEQAKQMRTAIMAQALDLRVMLRSIANTKNAAGKTHLGIVGSELDGEIDRLVKPLEEIANHIGNKEFGQAFQKQREIQAIKESTELGLMNSKEVGAWYRVSSLDSIKNNPVIAGVLNTMTAADKSIQPGLSGILDSIRKEIVTGQNIITPKGTVPNLKTTIGEFKDRGGKDFSSMLQVTKFITEPGIPDENKKNTLNFIFNEANKGVLDKFNLDEYRDGKLVPGKYYAYNHFLEPAVVKEAVRLGFGEQIKQWAGNEFGLLLSTDVMNLRDVFPKLHWDSDKSQFVLPMDVKMSELGIAQRNAYFNLNKALKTLSGVTNATGADTNTEVLKLLYTMGYDPNYKPAAPGKLPSAGEQIEALKKVPGQIGEAFDPRRDPAYEIIQGFGNMIVRAATAAGSAMAAGAKSVGSRADQLLSTVEGVAGTLPKMPPKRKKPGGEE